MEGVNNFKNNELYNHVPSEQVVTNPLLMNNRIEKTTHLALDALKKDESILATTLTTSSKASLFFQEYS